MQGISVRAGLSYRKKKVLSGARGLQEARATALRRDSWDKGTIFGCEGKVK